MFNKLILSGLATIFPLMSGANAIPVSNHSHSLVAQAQSTNVSDQELEKFAKIILEQAKLAKKTQDMMVTVLQREGLTQKRFREIAKQQSNSNSQAAEGVTSEEMQQYKQALPKIKSITETYKEKLQAMVKSEGFSVKRFNEIAIAVEDDKSLQTKITKMLGLPQ
ncbi:MAG TPA: hypothetical protein DCF68_07310 [Cyanothece sp. UBA12306]|nr:hypothetical protein [Cyanothece sp. UBA12306]